MKDKDYIKDLFSEKLSNHEVPVRNDLWSGIQSQIGNTATSVVVAKGISSSLKWMIGIASSVAVIGTAVWITSSNEKVDKPAKVQISQNSPKEIKSEEKITSPISSNSSENEMTNSAQNQLFVPQVELPNINFLDEWISRERQLGGLDNSGIPVSEPNDETIPNPIITESKAGAGNSINTIPTPNAQEVKPFEDGKIEEFFNVFTPNGDGMNDYFFLKSENLKDFTIRIFNERNEFVFQSTDKDFKWFGLDPAGNMVEAGNYGYVIFATDLNGKSIKMFKSLTIK